jgi:acyl-CoA thioesterase
MQVEERGRLRMEERQNLIEKNNQSTFAKHMGIKITELDYGSAKSMLRINQNHLNLYGTLHGGVLLSLADHTAGAAGSASALHEMKMALALQSNFSFLKTVGLKIGDEIRAQAVFVREGKRVVYVEVEVVDAKNELIAKMTLTGLKFK